MLYYKTELTEFSWETIKCERLLSDTIHSFYCLGNSSVLPYFRLIQ